MKDATSPQMTSLAERRLAVVRDVRLRLKAEHLRLTTGNYLHLDLDDIDPFEDDDPAQPRIDEIEGACFVCARGAILLSYVRLNNKLTMLEMACSDGNEANRKAIGDLFDSEQLGLIEAAYMQSSGYAKDRGVDQERALAASEFGGQHDTEEERLDSIMANMEMNEGVFVP